MEGDTESKRPRPHAEVGARLNACRKKAGLTLKEVADAIELKSADIIWRYEDGQVNIPMVWLQRLAALYEVSTDWLLRKEALSDEDALMQEAELMFRQVSAELSDEDKRSIRDFIRFVHERRRQEDREKEGGLDPLIG